MTRAAHIAALAVAGAVLATRPVGAGSVGLVVDGAVLSVPASSLAERRFRTVVKQRFDFSCGSAALATLLTYHYGRPTTEAEAFRRMWDAGDKAQIRVAGFSLLDMKLYLDSVGLAADGFKVRLEDVARVRLPVVALIETRGYKHFVVIKGMRGDSVLIGDPALGLRTMPRAAFARAWDGVVLAVRGASEQARASFDAPGAWPARAAALPLGEALSRDGLASFTALLPAPNNF